MSHNARGDRLVRGATNRRERDTLRHLRGASRSTGRPEFDRQELDGLGDSLKQVAASILELKA
jgi:hypothetical protein